jgi:hypothetical protein
MGLKARRPVSDPHAFERIDREVVTTLGFTGTRGGWKDREDSTFSPLRSRMSPSGR